MLKEGENNMCNSIIEQLPAYIAEELEAEEKREVEGHLADCASCTLELQAFQKTWNLLDKWEDVVLAEELRSSVLAQVQELIDAEKAGRANWWRYFKGFSHIVYGTLTAILSVLLLVSRANTGSLTPRFILGFSVIWTGLYILAFWLTSRRGDQVASEYNIPLISFDKAFGPVDLARITYAGLVSIAISLIISWLIPIDSVVKFCLTQPGLQGVADKVSIAGLYFLFGGLYALIPLLVVAVFVGRKVSGSPVSYGLSTGIVFVLLIIPGILLQCGPLTLGMLMGWILGTALGSMAGGVTGYWIAFRTREVTT
jgi:hypothetical protein